MDPCVRKHGLEYHYALKVENLCGDPRADNVGACVSVIGFAFYLQPIAMPMLREMPPGEIGYKILSFCMRTTIMGALSFIMQSCCHTSVTSSAPARAPPSWVAPLMYASPLPHCGWFATPHVVAVLC